MYLPPRFFLPLSLLCLFLLLGGCASKNEPRVLLPASVALPHYSTSDKTGIFSNDSLRVTATPLSMDNSLRHPLLVRELLKMEHPVFSITIENLSDKKVIFNPDFSSATDNRLGFRRPLDHTDLFFLVRSMEGGGKLLKNMKGRFYDLTETVPPGGRSDKLLIFKPFEEKSTKATLTMQEVYVGDETVQLTFPFLLIVESKISPTD